MYLRVCKAIREKEWEEALKHHVSQRPRAPLRTALRQLNLIAFLVGKCAPDLREKIKIRAYLNNFKSGLRIFCAASLGCPLSYNIVRAMI